jgi:hypothetical protein
MGELKYVHAADLLLDTGLLFQINKDILHPLGLALSVNIDDKTGEKTLSQDLWDCRDDVDGLIYTDETFKDGSEKLEKFYTEVGLDKLEKRREKLGYIVQGELKEDM